MENSILKNLGGIVKDSSNVAPKGKFRVKKLPMPVQQFDFQQLQENPISSDEPVIPQTIQEKVVEKIKQQKIQNLSDLKVNALLKVKKLKEVGDIKFQATTDNSLTTEERSDINDKLEAISQQVNEKTDIPENVDVFEIANEISTAVEEIPELKDVDVAIDDFNITEYRSKEGYIKNKVTIKSEVGSVQLSNLATLIKKQTDGIVLHRAMDVRTVGNTNKTQLKTSELKLHAISYVFRPLSGKTIQAKKYQRFIISINLDFESTNKITIYLQESRDKLIIEIPFDLEFIARVISDFYVVGFGVTKARLLSNDNNEFNVIMNKLALSGIYKVKPIIKEGVANRIMIMSKSGKYQWLYVLVSKLNIQGTYKIEAKSKIDSNWSGIRFNHPEGVNVPITKEFLLSERFQTNLHKIFNEMDWSKYVNENTDDEHYMLSKLTYRPLKRAFIEMLELQELGQIGLEINGTLSQADTKKDPTIDDDYESEVIVGKTKHIDFFILAWSAVKISGGNNRVSPKTGKNYDARPYLFTLVYSVNGIKKTVQHKDFDTIKLSGFLTETPN